MKFEHTPEECDTSDTLHKAIRGLRTRWQRVNSRILQSAEHPQIQEPARHSSGRNIPSDTSADTGHTRPSQKSS